MKPNRSRSGAGSRPARVVAPTRVNGAMSSGIEVAPGPLPIMTSTRKSSMARYSNSSAGRATRWISSMNMTSPWLSVDSTAARSPARSMAGPLVIRSGMPSSAAMIMAMVVLPSPGGPDSSTWSGARPRRIAPSSTSESCSRTRVWPTNSSSRLGRSAPSTSRSSSSASGDTTRSCASPGSLIARAASGPPGPAAPVLCPLVPPSGGAGGMEGSSPLNGTVTTGPGPAGPPAARPPRPPRRRRQPGPAR